MKINPRPVNNPPRRTLNVLAMFACFLLGVLGAAPIAGGKPVVSSSTNPPTPYATLLQCDQKESSYVLWTLQSSSSKSDELEQRYETQVLMKDSDSKSKQWETVDRTSWRDIPREGRDVISKTTVNVSNAEGKRFRELARFRWRYQSAGKTRTKEATRTTKGLDDPVKGRANCSF